MIGVVAASFIQSITGAVAVKAVEVSNTASVRYDWPLAVPAATAVGDLMVIVIAGSWDVQTSSAPGWTQASIQNGAWFNGGLFWKVAEAADLGTSVLMDFYDFTPATAEFYVLSGANSLDLLAAERGGNGGSGAWAQSVVTGAPGDLMLYAGITRLDAGSGIPPTISRGTADINQTAPGGGGHAARGQSEPLAAIAVSQAVTFTAAQTDNGHWYIVARANKIASGTYSYTNPSPSGVTTISSSGSSSESVIAGMDTSSVIPHKAATVTINLWEAMYAPGVGKGCIARLRDGGPTGPILASQAFGDAGDSTGGHQQQWSYSGTVTPATNRLCVTIQQTGGTPQITSDTRTFTITQT